MRVFLLFLLVLSGAEAGRLAIPPWVGDHMVVPANSSFGLSGMAAPGVEVVVEYAGYTFNTVAGRQGDWAVAMRAWPVGTTGTLTITADDEVLSFDDVVTGEVWLCAGQSNMVRRVSASAEAELAVADIAAVDVRYFNGQSWVGLTPRNVGTRSAVATFFAIARSQRQACPIGVHVAARGGTGIEAWMPATSFPDTPRGRTMRSLVGDPEVLRAAAEDRLDHRSYGEHRLARWGLGRAVPTEYFEQLVRPLARLPLTGMLWYQGESNADTRAGAGEYGAWLTGLVAAYRGLWHRTELPVVVIQLPAYDPGTPEKRAAWAQVQAAQETVALATADMVVVDIKDLGEPDDVHPRRKRGVGVRAAAAANALFRKP